MLTADACPDRTDRVFYRLAGMELWERFSLHGMKALLTLYLVDEVLVTRAAMPWGLGSLRTWLEAAWGPLTPLAFASQLYGFYGALTYLALPIGGFAGDRLMGRRAAVLTGAGLIAGGHACLTVPALLLTALALLIAGTGLLKANLAAQIGALYPLDDSRRGTAFARYLAFLNVGVMLGPLVCGWLAQQYGWSYGFGAAGVAMAIGIALFVGTPAIVPMSADSIEAGRERKADASPMAAFGAIVVTILSFSAYEQVSNIFLVWIDRTIELRIGDFIVPPAWFLAADGLITIAIALVTIRHPRLARLPHGDRLLWGCVAIIGGYVLLSLVSLLGERSILAPIAYLACLDLGIVLIWPAALAIVTAASPRRYEGAIVGIFYLHGFFANLVVGGLGSQYERIAPPLFWLLHAGIAGIGAIVAVALRHRLQPIAGMLDTPERQLPGTTPARDQ